MCNNKRRKRVVTLVAGTVAVGASCAGQDCSAWPRRWPLRPAGYSSAVAASAAGRAIAVGASAGLATVAAAGQGIAVAAVTAAAFAAGPSVAGPLAADPFAANESSKQNINLSVTPSKNIFKKCKRPAEAFAVAFVEVAAFVGAAAVEEAEPGAVVVPGETKMEKS